MVKGIGSEDGMEAEPERERISLLVVGLSRGERGGIEGSGDGMWWWV